MSGAIAPHPCGSPTFFNAFGGLLLVRHRGGATLSTWPGMKILHLSKMDAGGGAADAPPSTGPVTTCERERLDMIRASPSVKLLKAALSLTVRRQHRSAAAVDVTMTTTACSPPAWPGSLPGVVFRRWSRTSS